MSARRKGWSVHHRVRFKKLADSKKIREDAEQGGGAPIRIVGRFTVIRRNGREVLHLLSDYYSYAVLEAAHDEDIAALGIRGYGVSTKIFNDDVYVGSVSPGPNGNQRTVEAIERSVNNYAGRNVKKPVRRNAGNHAGRRATYYNPRLSTGRSITRSTQPVIPQEIADKGVENAKRGRTVLGPSRPAPRKNNMSAKRAKRNRWHVTRRVRVKNLVLSERIREAAAQGDDASIRFGDRYAVIMRGGRPVLNVLYDYYSYAVLEAAQDEGIEPFGTRGHNTATPLYLGDLFVGEVNYPPNGNQQTVEAIQRNINNYIGGKDSGKSRTLSTQPVIPQEIADKGVSKAKRGRNR